MSVKSQCKNNVNRKQWTCAVMSPTNGVSTIIGGEQQLGGKRGGANMTVHVSDQHTAYSTTIRLTNVTSNRATLERSQITHVNQNDLTKILGDFIVLRTHTKML